MDSCIPKEEEEEDKVLKSEDFSCKPLSGKKTTIPKVKYTKIRQWNFFDVFLPFYLLFGF
jgi:hypothetical protein